jgi:dTDP-4-amino-4,6-dideoxygalactose transaminase
MDPNSLEECITDKTEAVIPVHLYGQPCDMYGIIQVVDDNALWLIEDCSHAHGVIFNDLNGQRLGSIGDVATFSFYPTKPLGAMGDAGAILADDADITERCRRIRNHGRLSRDDFRLVGRNSRMDAIQAAVLDAKLPYLDQWNETRREIAGKYRERLNVPVQPSQTYHQLVVQVDNRDAVQAALREAGIDTLVHYPYIIPDLAPYSVPNWVNKVDWPVAKYASERVLSLPMDLYITDEIIDTIAGVLS